ncbi:MAG TPA: ATP-binding protein [Gemmatimonadaceae bacterium]
MPPEKEPFPARPESSATIQEALRHCVQQAPLPFAVTRGDDHTLAYANSAFTRLTSVPGGAVIGKSIDTVFGSGWGRELHTLLDRAYRDGTELLDEKVRAPRGDANDWYFSVWPVTGDDARIEALGVQIRMSDPLEPALGLQRQVAEQLLLGALRERGFAEDAEAARRHAAFLAEAGRLLAESVDKTSTFVALAKLSLPTLGAWCIMDVLGSNDSIHRLGIYHPDPEKQALARELETSWAPDPSDPFGAPAMLRGARTIEIAEDIEPVLAKAARSAENLRILRRLGIGALLTVPLVARDRLLGAITFVSAQPDLTYTPQEIQLAEDLAARGALALDNAQAYDLALIGRRKAEVANEAKAAFLSAMSHELRTPLNAIGGYIDLLDMGLRGPVTEEQHADFARVKASQQHLNHLITEILSFARLESGRVAFIEEDINVRKALEYAIELVEPLFAMQRVVFDGITCDPGAVACADREKVTQILVNLLGNAIKFTPAGGHIWAECEVAGDAVMLRVSDTGIGIPAEKLHAIFEAFVQVKAGFATRESGIGLGLAISRDLARAMKGDLTVESGEGTGSCFTLTLPRAGTASAG